MKCFVKIHITLGFLLLFFRMAESDNSDEDKEEEEEFGGVNIKVFRGPSKTRGNETFAPFGYHVKMPPIHSSKSNKKKLTTDQEEPFDFDDNEPFDFSSNEDMKKETETFTSDEQDQNEEPLDFTSKEHNEDVNDFSEEKDAGENDLSEEDNEHFDFADDEPNIDNKPFDGREEDDNSNEQFNVENQERNNGYNSFPIYNKAESHLRPRNHDRKEIVYGDGYNNERVHQNGPPKYANKDYNLQKEIRSGDQTFSYSREDPRLINQRFNDYKNFDYPHNDDTFQNHQIVRKIPSHSIDINHSQFRKLEPVKATNRYHNQFKDTLPIDVSFGYYNKANEYNRRKKPVDTTIKNYNHYEEFHRTIPKAKEPMYISRKQHHRYSQPLYFYDNQRYDNFGHSENSDKKFHRNYNHETKEFRHRW